MILLFTGNGKGKTTSAIGIVLRALGNMKVVNWVSFLKGQQSGEHTLFRFLSTIHINGEHLSSFKYLITGREEFVFGKSIPRDYEEAHHGLMFAHLDGDLIVLDELTHALNLGLIKQEQVENLINQTEAAHIVITGSNAPQWLIDKCDLVTTMVNTKHYYDTIKQPILGLDY